MAFPATVWLESKRAQNPVSPRSMGTMGPAFSTLGTNHAEKLDGRHRKIVL
jgi:hypothetical protein